MSDEITPKCVAPITPQRLTDIFEEHKILNANQIRPSAGSLRSLAAELEALRRKELSIQKKGSEMRRSGIEEAWRKINDLRSLVELLELEDETLADEALQAMRALDRLMQKMEPALRERDSPALTARGANRGRPRARWTRYASAIAEGFRHAMRSNNTDPKIGKGQGNAVARFVHAVAPMITGETMPEIESVGQAINRAQRGTGKKSQDNCPGLRVAGTKISHRMSRGEFSPHFVAIPFFRPARFFSTVD